MSSLSCCCCTVSAWLLVSLCLLVVVCNRVATFIRNKKHNKKFTIGFFHPFCNSGGGGERVLWQYIRTLQQTNDSSLEVVIYTGDIDSEQEILQRAAERFNLPPIVSSSVTLRFIRLQHRRWITAEAWPRFTMIGQSLGSMLLSLECLLRYQPHLFIDTTGFAFTYPVARFLFNCSIHCYTHYPTISNDMLQLVYERRPSYNNSSEVSGSYLKARIKWVYYKAFALLYSLCGRCATFIFVNSSWTAGHINSLWAKAAATHTVFPPCETANLRKIPLGTVATTEATVSSTQKNKNNPSSSAPTSGLREDIIISLGQFRPEKDHELQLRSFARFQEIMKAKTKACPSWKDTLPTVRLVLIGGARDAGDKARVERLKKLAVELDVSELVQFEINVPFKELSQWLAKATVGIHTMWNEHFGIGVVEFMAAGVIPLAHNSGGPKSDIVVPASGEKRVGFLAATAEEYARAMEEIFLSEFKGSAAMQTMRIAAREKAEEFSDDVFINQLNKLFLPFIQQCKKEHASQ